MGPRNEERRANMRAKRAKGDEMAETEHPCAECGEPTLNPSLCRGCGIDQSVSDASCSECHVPIWNEMALTLGMVPFAHTDACVVGREERRYGEGLVKGWTMAFEMGAGKRKRHA